MKRACVLLRRAALLLCILLPLLVLLLPLTVFFTTTDGGGTWSTYLELLLALFLLTLPFFVITECILLGTERYFAYRLGGISKKRLLFALLCVASALLLTLLLVALLAMWSDARVHITLS